MSLFHQQANLKARVEQLEAFLLPLIRGGVSTASLVGIMPSQVSLRLDAVAADPAYVDGKAIIYFYSSGGTDELRVRGKVGATETQVTLANISP